MDVGSELRDARERRRLSIGDLSRRTKIKPATLSAIDRNDRAHLPGGIFTRAFVKQYAREVGLDPADTVQRYEAQFVPEPVVTVPAAENTPVDIEDVTAEERAPAPLGLDDVRLLVIAAVLMLAAVSYVAFNRPHAQIPRAASRAAADVNPVAPAASTMGPTSVPQPTGTSGSTRAAPASATSAHGLRIELRLRGTCWITATADGKLAAFRLMNGGERLTLDASNEVVLRVGDAASLDFSVNGSLGRSLGGRAEAVTIRLTPANYREFVAP